MTDKESNGLILRSFFRCFPIGFLISCFRIDVGVMKPIQVVETLFTAFWYNTIVGICSGLTAMFTSMAYVAIKKNGISE